MAKHLIVRGLVQGVGYRATLGAQARAMRLCGWARNRSDGSVEAVLRGDPESLQALIDWAREGPPAARVEHISVTDIADEEVEEGVFHTRSTV